MTTLADLLSPDVQPGQVWKRRGTSEEVAIRVVSGSLVRYEPAGQAGGTLAMGTAAVAGTKWFVENYTP